MQRSELEHIIRAAGEITREKDFIIVGSQSILGAKPDAPRTLRRSIEADIYPMDKPELADLIDGNIGELTKFHQQFSYYAHGVGPETAILPVGWRERLIPVRNENTNGATGWCLDINDLAYSKLAAGREKDIEFVEELRRHGILKVSALEKLMMSAPDDRRELMQNRWRQIVSRVHLQKGLARQAMENFTTRATDRRERDDNARSL